MVDVRVKLGDSVLMDHLLSVL